MFASVGALLQLACCCCEAIATPRSVAIRACTMPLLVRPMHGPFNDQLLVSPLYSALLSLGIF